MAAKIQLRGDTIDNWNLVNPVLLSREIGIDISSNRFKIGDGVHTWDELDYYSSGKPFQEEIDEAIGTDDGTIIDYETEYTPTESFTSVAGYWFIQPQLISTQPSFLNTVSVISIASSAQTFGVFEKVGDWDFKLIQTFVLNTNSGNNTLNVDDIIPMNNNYTLGIFVNATSGIYAKEGGLEPYRYCSFDGTINVNDTETFTPPGNASGVIGLGFSVQLADGQPKITTSKFIQETYELINGSSYNCERVLMEGQSNCLGVGASSALQSVPYTDVYFDWEKEFDRVYIWDKFAEEYVKLKIGVNNVSAWDGRYTAGAPIPYSTIGVEVGFVINWLECNRTGLLFIDKFVKDGAPIADFQKGQAYYTELLEQRNIANEWLEGRGLLPKEIGFVWVQGEGDMFNTEFYYRGKLDALISDRLTDGILADTSTIVLAQIGVNSDNYSSNIADAKDSYASDNIGTKLITYIDEYNLDDIHLNTNGCMQLGLDAYRAISDSDLEEFDNVPHGKVNWTV